MTPMSLLDLPFQFLYRTALKHLTLPEIVILSSLSAKFKTGIYDSASFWWSKVIHDLTENPRVLHHIKQEGKHPRCVFEELIKLNERELDRYRSKGTRINHPRDRIIHAALNGYEKFIQTHFSAIEQDDEAVNMCRSIMRGICLARGYTDIFKFGAGQDKLLECLSDATISGNLDIVQYIIENSQSQPGLQEAIDVAFTHGILVTCPQNDDDDEPLPAAEIDNDHTNSVLNYLQSLGAHYLPEEADMAMLDPMTLALITDLRYVRYLLNYGVPLPDDCLSITLCQSEIPYNQVEGIARYLIDERGITTDPTRLSGIPDRYLNIVPYLVERGILPTNLMNAVSRTKTCNNRLLRR